MAIRRTRSRVRRATTRRTVSRSPRRGSHAGSPWSREEIAFMRKYYRNNETAWVASQLGRTVYSVRYKASDLNIRKANPSVWKGNTGTARKSSWNAKSRVTSRTSRSYRASSRRKSWRRPKTRR